MAAQRGLNKRRAGASSALTSDMLDALVARAARPDYPRFEAQLRSSGYCAHPVRLTGRVETCDAGGRRRVWSTGGEPDGILRKACGNRREAICPSCAERYRQDAYQLIAAGLRGGKGVPDTIAGHPAVFVTFTAPGFGAVHTRRHARDGRPLRCRPRRDAPVCPHGVTLWCGAVHEEDDSCLGEPLCADCFDHEAAVRWNNTLGELWRRTMIYLPRVLARLTGVTQRRLRERVRVSYVKVAEYQRRGLVHLHAVIRLDRALPAYRAGEPRSPAPTFTTDLLEDAIRTTVREARAPLPDELGGADVRWGDELDVRRLDIRERRRVAGYLAKYATKSTEHAGGVLHRVAREQVDELPVSEHIRRYLHAAFTLHDRAHAASDDEDASAPPPPPRPAPDTSRDPNLPARRAVNATSHGEPVRVRLDDGSQHSGRIIRRDHHELVPDDGQALATRGVDLFAGATPALPRERRDRRLAACAHALGFRGHCLTKSRRYSTTFKALREARERHIHEQLLKHSRDAAQRALAETAASDRFSSLRYIGQGHLTAADSFLAASAAARAREQRRAAREALCDDQRPER